MNYRLFFTSQARRELSQAALWWAENRDPGQAARWIEACETAIQTAKENPERYPVIRENHLYSLRYTYRRVLFGLGKKATHRAVYRIQGDTIYVVAVRHLSQQDIRPDDIL